MKVKKANTYFGIILSLLYSFMLVAENSIALRKNMPVHCDEQSTSCMRDEPYCDIRADAQGNVIIIIGADIEALVGTFINDVEHHNAQEKLSQNLLLFCEKVLSGEKEFSLEEIQQVLSELVAFASGKIESIRAPRPDAPGNTNGAPVGTLLECDVSQIEQLINRLIQIVTQCCATLQQDFQYTWTILADIKQTITTDFNGTFTFLNEIYNTLTTCCATIEQDFEFTWTILADIKQTITNDFNGTFTVLNEINDTLTTCCATLEQDFEFTWTILADIKQTITNDFNGTFTFLNEINNTLTTCCATLEQDFEFTWTILADIKETITTDFNGTFTFLNEINDTLTSCCAAIQVDFEGVFTVLSDIQSTITTDFAGTFTVLASFQGAVCSPVSITTSTIITVSGYYCLANDIVGTVTITANNVTVDLNNHTITAPGATGIFIDDTSNAIVTNGKINNTVSAVEINVVSSLIMSELFITNCSDTAILFNSTNPVQSGVILHDIVIDTCSTGIATAGSIIGSELNTITIRRTTGIAVNMTINSSLFKDVQVMESGNNPSANTAYLLGGSNNKLINCSVMQFTGLRGFNLSMNDSILENCTIQDVAASVPNSSQGIMTVGSEMVFKNCSVINLQGVPAIGFWTTQGGSAVWENCIAERIIGADNSGSGFQAANIAAVHFIGCQAFGVEGYGFFLQGELSDGIIVENCISANNNVDGFNITGTTLLRDCTAFANGHNGFNVAAAGVSLLDCEAASNAQDGFVLNDTSAMVGNCTSYGNSGNGFDVTVASVRMYGCFATNNSLADYTAGCPNTQNANTQVNTSVVGLTGPYARGNTFI